MSREPSGPGQQPQRRPGLGPVPRPLGGSRTDDRKNRHPRRHLPGRPGRGPARRRHALGPDRTQTADRRRDAGPGRGPGPGLRRDRFRKDPSASTGSGATAASPSARCCPDFSPTPTASPPPSPSSPPSPQPPASSLPCECEAPTTAPRVEHEPLQGRMSGMPRMPSISPSQRLVSARLRRRWGRC
jgi:hypothetical protein